MMAIFLDDVAVITAKHADQSIRCATHAVQYDGRFKDDT